MNRDLRIVSEKTKPYYTLTLKNGEEYHMLQPTLETYFKVIELKKLEQNIETLEESFDMGIDLVLDYMNSNIEKKKFKKSDILKEFTIPNIQTIIGDIWNYALGIDTEKNF